MDNLKDDIKIMRGDKATMRKAKWSIIKRKINDEWQHRKFQILLIMNGFKF